MIEAIEKVFIIQAPYFLKALESEQVPKIGAKYVVAEITGAMIQTDWCRVAVRLEPVEAELAKTS